MAATHKMAATKTTSFQPEPVEINHTWQTNTKCDRMRSDLPWKRQCDRIRSSDGTGCHGRTEQTLAKINNKAMEKNDGHNGDQPAETATAKTGNKNNNNSEPSRKSETMTNEAEETGPPPDKSDKVENESDLKEGDADGTKENVIDDATDAENKDDGSQSSRSRADLTAIASLNALGGARKDGNSDGDEDKNPPGETIQLILRQNNHRYSMWHTNYLSQLEQPSRHKHFKRQCNQQGNGSNQYK
jgi:hypothetical protein